MTSKIVVNNIESDAGVSTVFFNSDIGATDGTLNVDGNLTVDGVITYEDVINVDSIGIITARSGINATGDITFGANSKAKLFENGTQSGVQATSSTSSAHLMTHDGNEDIHVDPSGYIKVEVAGSERLRITSAGKVGIGTDNPYANNHIEIDVNAGAGSGSAAALWLKNANQTANNSATIFFGNNVSQAAGAINFIHKDYSTNAGDITFDTRTNGSTYAERLRITSGGDVCVGGHATNYADSPLEVRSTNAGGDVAIRVTNNSTDSGTQAGIIFTTTTADYTTAGIGFERGTADALKFYVGQSAGGGGFTNATERLRISSSGDLFVAGTGGMNTTQLPNGSTINVNGTSSNDGLSVIRYSTGYGAYGLNIGRSKSDTLGTNAAVTDGNDLGHISFYGADGTDFNMAAQITSQVDGTPSDGTDMPGRLIFKTSSDASATPTERLRITSAGQVNVNQANNNNLLGQLTIFEGTDFNISSQGGRDNIYLISDKSSGYNSYGSSIAWSRVQYADRRAAAIANVQTSTDEDHVGLAFFTHPSADATANIEEKFRITHDGIHVTNGVSNFYVAFRLSNNQSYNWDIAVPNEGGYGNSFRCECGYNHYYTAAYGAHRSAWISTRGTSSNNMFDQDQSHSQSGAWSFSKPNNTTFRVTKSAGTYGGQGYGFIHVRFNYF